jgi:hypothetical protein
MNWENRLVELIKDLFAIQMPSKHGTMSVAFFVLLIIVAIVLSFKETSKDKKNGVDK